MPTTHYHPTNRFSANCDHCVYPIVVESEQTNDKMRVTCPNCGTTGIMAERLYGSLTDRNCDARCQFAIGNMCSCACGGANHRAGFLPPVAGEDVPASIINRFRNAARLRVERGQARRERNAQTRAERIQAGVDAFLDSEPEVAEAIDRADRAEFGETYAQRVISDIAAKLRQSGSISDRQAAFITKLADEHDQRIAAQERNARRMAAEAQQPKADAPSGRVEITGVVVARKLRETDFGPVYKLLVRVGDMVGGFYKVWVSEPSSITCERFDVVTMKATLKPSDRDANFAFGSRPTGAAIIGHAEVDLDADDEMEDAMSPMVAG